MLRMSLLMLLLLLHPLMTLSLCLLLRADSLKESSPSTKRATLQELPPPVFSTGITFPSLQQELPFLPEPPGLCATPVKPATTGRRHRESETELSERRRPVFIQFCRGVSYSSWRASERRSCWSCGTLGGFLLWEPIYSVCLVGVGTVEERSRWIAWLWGASWSGGVQRECFWNMII